MYCSRCGAINEDTADFCRNCGEHFQKNPQNTNNYSVNVVLLNKVKSCKTTAQFGIFLPIAACFASFLVILIIFITGPCDGDLSNINYINHYEAEEFLTSYGLVFVLSLIGVIPTVIVMIKKTNQLRKFQDDILTKPNNLDEICSNFYKDYKTGSVLFVSILFIVFSVIPLLFLVPQIIICVRLNSLKNFCKFSF